MTDMDHRAWITVPGLRLEDEACWEPFIEALERSAADYGPVLAFDNGAAQIVMSTDASTPKADAVGAFVSAISRALHDTGLLDLHPATIELETVDEPTRVAA